MALPEFSKQPCERYFVGVDYVKALGPTETIVLAASTISAVDKDEIDAASEVFEAASEAVDGTRLIVRVMDGDPAKSKYKLTFCAKTDEGNVYEQDIRMKVKEL